MPQTKGIISGIVVIVVITEQRQVYLLLPPLSPL
jgi:hypothetical protein